MASVGQKNTKPELVVRRALHSFGFRFRLYEPTLPGHPDIVLPKHGAVIMVHGCFWHGHGCRRRALPSSNTDFWRSKIERNMHRDAVAVSELEDLGWRVLTLWECAILSNSETRAGSLASVFDWIRSDLPSRQVGRSDSLDGAKPRS